MPIVNKQVRLLGREPIPRFAVGASLHWLGYQDASQPSNFPAQFSIYNVAALALYAREGSGGFRTFARSMTFWSHTTEAGIDLIYGRDEVSIPHDCEWFSVAWLTPPSAWYTGSGPYPEEMFRIRWKLQV